MARSLRPRKSQLSYSASLDFASDEEFVVPQDDDASGDDFQPVKEQADKAEEAKTDGSSDEVDELDDDGEVKAVKKTSKAKSQKKSVKVVTVPIKEKTSKKASTAKLAYPSISRPSNRQQYALPMPSQEHRHRSKPLYRTKARVERLVNPPQPFGPSVTIPTNNWTMNETITERYNKASGYNIGPGPLWDFMEDRSWWKESLPISEGETETEATRRPRVYEDVRVHGSLTVLDEISAQSYVPTRYNNNGTASSCFRCSFGPFASQTQRDIKTFEAIKMSEWYSESKAHVFNAGSPVWALDWCPIHVEDQPHRHYKQYLAVAPFPSNQHTPKIGVKCPTPSPACIQIWSFGPKSMKGKDKAADASIGQVKCELVVGIDCGPARDLKWCPLPSHDSWTSSRSSLRKLGIVAGTFEDGSLSLFVVPDPEDIERKDGGPAYVRLEPSVRVAMEDTSFWSLDWANSERLVVGCTNGFVAVYDINDAILSKTLSTGRSSKPRPVSSCQNEEMTDLLPLYYICLHQSAIRTLQWVRVPRVSADGAIQRTGDPTVIISGGFDGCEVFTDLRELSGNISNRTRDVVHSMSYSTYTVGMIAVDHDNTVKAYTLDPTMLARGHLVIEAGGPVWSIDCSDYHPQLAVASADGSVVTTNALRSTRRSVATPFLSYKIFQMDYNRKTGEYRMLDQFKPHEFFDKVSSKRSSNKRKPETTHEGGTTVWPAEVSATCVSWNNGGGLARAPLLASATVSGLCRIDWLTGMFLRDREPYGGIQFIRQEVDTDDVDMDDEDDE